jgi:hypothetical protein
MEGALVVWPYRSAGSEMVLYPQPVAAAAAAGDSFARFCRFASGQMGAGGGCAMDDSSELWDLLRESEWELAMQLLARDPQLASRAVRISSRETDVMFPLHYALEWGAPVGSVRLLLAAHPAAASSCKGEHAPVNRAVDTTLSLFVRRLLSRSVSEGEIETFLAEEDAADSVDPPSAGRSAGQATVKFESLSDAQREFLTELFQETIGILSALFEHFSNQEEVVVALHCANHIQAAATVVLARALHGPAVRVRNLHLGAKSLPDKFFAGMAGVAAMAKALTTNHSLEALDLSCCAPLHSDRDTFSTADIETIVRQFAKVACFNNTLCTLQLPFALEVKQESGSRRSGSGRQSPPASISPEAALLRRCLQRNEDLAASVSAQQRLCLAMALHPRLGVHSGNTSSTNSSTAAIDDRGGVSSNRLGLGAMFRLPADLLQLIGNEVLMIGLMEEGARKRVVQRYCCEPRCRQLLLDVVGCSKSPAQETPGATDSPSRRSPRREESLSGAPSPKRAKALTRSRP